MFFVLFFLRIFSLCFIRPLELMAVFDLVFDPVQNVTQWERCND